MGCYASKDAAAGNQAVDRVVKRLEEQLVPAGPPNGKDQQQQGAAALDGYPFYGDLEAARLKALTDCRVLDTPAEARFDNITKLLQGIFQVPMALVSLIDHDRLVFHSIAGPAGPGGRRIHSFCDESLKAANPRMMVVEDTLQDARFQHSQFVEGEPHVRFYSGAPLVSSEGYVMGSLGILDLVPRKFSADLYNMICNFAELVVRELERDKIAELQRLEAARLAEAQRSLVRALSCFDEAIVLVDATSPTDWKIKYANGAWSKLTGLSEKASTETPFWDLVRLSDPKQDLTRIQDTISAREPFTLRLAVQNNSNGGTEGSLVLRFRPATNDHLSLQAPLIGIPNFVEPTTSKEAYPSIHYFAVAQAYVPETPKGVLPNGIAATRTSSNTLSSASSLPLSLSSRYGSVSGRGSGGSGGSGAAHACFGLDRPETLKELKLGPMLGKGSYGKVYRGLWHGAQVAVKVMDSFVDLDPATGNPIPQELAKGPMLEALLSKELPHPHIVQTYEFATRVESESDQIPEDTPILGHPGSGDTDSPFGSAGAQEGGAVAALPPRQLQRMWIIQEFCNHGTLYDATDRGWLRAKRDLDGSTNYLAVLQTAQEIASAMQYLHSRGIVHGDLTGNNVLLKSSSKDQRRFIAMVGDFGLSRVLNQDDPIATQSLGTVTHMPPEALIHGEVTKSVDVYSMGVLLWELYCHQRAWCGRVPSQVVYMVATLGRKLELPEHAPAPYKELATACMHSEREKRPSFEEVFSRLETMLAEERLVCGAGTQQELP